MPFGHPALWSAVVVAPLPVPVPVPLSQQALRHARSVAAAVSVIVVIDPVVGLCPPAATQALVAPMDQTRTVGLVTRPGAFVGVLIGTGNPVQAAAAQVLVLIGLLGADAIAVVLELVARGTLIRAPAPRPR